ncbi:MAG: 3-oxoacyl-[acyl-carrier-protein] synthase 3 [bacterium P3]|nr:MAG: 3-oxoacyl-[acyl-carrier-protein] synthase 3 [bacterium P3]KWW42719.1 MAG: 3-oxoacyl-[acyl-carrier-protein] synthase 3 [bacterium F083]
MKIIGTGSAVPEHIVDNNMLSQILDTSDEWITTRTGIQRRHIMSNEYLIDLAIEASRNAIAMSGVNPKEIDFIICSNVASNYVTPALSTIVEGAVGCECPCIDLNGACAGFIYALDYADAYFVSRGARNILVVCAEEPTRFVNWKQRENCVLFGDGAGAVVLTRGNNLLASRLRSISNKEVITYRRRLERTPYETEGVNVDEPLIMNGREVFRMAVTASQQDLMHVLEHAGVAPQDVKYYMLHQANQRIIDSIQEHMHLPQKKFPSIIAEYGNTSSASIPIMMDLMNRKGELHDGDLIALSAFGAGFVSAAALLRWAK